MKRFVYGAATVTSGAEGGLAIARVSGVVTPNSAGKIISGLPQWGGPAPPLSVVADYSGAAIGITPDQLLAAVHLARERGMQIIPVALVANQDQLGDFHRYAIAASAAGMLKAAFLCPEQARRWAARQALVRARWLELRRPVVSTP